MGRFSKPIHSLTVAGVDLSTYCGLYISGSGTFKSFERDYEMIEVPGRTGDLILDSKRLKNGTITYPAFIIEDFSSNMEKLRNYLLSLPADYSKISDTYHPNEYRLGILTGEIDPDTIDSLEAGSFDINFYCKPQRFLKTGDNKVTFTTSGTLDNPTRFPAKPLIRVYGNGTININGTVVHLSNTGTYTDLDCDEQDAFQGATNRNKNIVIDSDSFPVLNAGGNSIIVGAGITKIEITPRWYLV